MDDDEANTPDQPLIEPPPSPPAPPWAPASSEPAPFQPPPMTTLPPPATTTIATTEQAPKRRFPWVTLVVGLLALAAIVVLGVMLISASSDKDDSEQALAEAQTDLENAEADLAASEAALTESEAALAQAESDLSSTAAELADAQSAKAEAQAAQADAEAARDEHQQQLADYEEASTEFLTASMVAGVGLSEDDARCLAQATVDELGAQAMSLIAAAALNGEDASKLDETMMAAADGCGVSEDAFDDPTESDAFSYGDDPELDALYDACEGGDGKACDDLYVNSAPGSDYEQFAGTCGNRFEYSDTEPCDGRIV
jgi:hypothetical protein